MKTRLMAVLLAMAYFSAAAAEPAFAPLPEFAEHADIQYVSEFDPRAITPESDARAEALLVTLAEIPDLGLAFEELGSAGLSPLQHDRVAVVLVEQVAEDGELEDIPALEAIAAISPTAIYLAPGCKHHDEHFWFDFQSAAHNAIGTILYRDARYAAIEWLPECGGDPLLAIADREEDLRRFAGAVSAMISLTDSYLESRSILHTLPPHLVPPELADYSLPLFLDSVDGEDERIAVLLAVAVDLRDIRLLSRLALYAPVPVAQIALVRFEAIRPQRTVASLRAYWRPGMETVVLGLLAPRDASPEVTEWLVSLFGDERAGADAAEALLRIAPEDAVPAAEGLVLKSAGDDVAVRRAVLLLMREGSDSSKAALAYWAQTKDGDEAQTAMKEEVTRWLAE